MGTQEMTVRAKHEPADREGRVLVVEADEETRGQLRWGLCDRFEVWLAEDTDAARAAVRSRRFEAASLDLSLPPDPSGATEGFRLLEEFLIHDPAMKVVVVTANSDRQHAVRAVQLGAFDYFLKPIDLRQLELILQRACRLSQLDREAFGLEVGLPREPGDDVIGNGAAMRRAFDTVQRVARTDVTVLISGERGTGKELIARAIHAQSPRRQRPFVAVNCAAIPANLMESELFGLEEGPQAPRPGQLELADGGTIFLDEIGELTAAMQVKLLRVLHDRRLERQGGRERVPVDVRVLAANNQELRPAVAEGRFREDLYYRLAVVRIEIPPLRERLEDLPVLANRFLERFSLEYKVRPRPFSAEALTAVHLYRWPGNIRELENRIKRAVIMAQGRRITAADLELEPAGLQAMPTSLKVARNEAERRVLVDALQRYRGNISQAARAVQISRPAFHELLTKHGLRAETFKAVEAGKTAQR